MPLGVSQLRKNVNRLADLGGSLTLAACSRAEEPYFGNTRSQTLSGYRSFGRRARSIDPGVPDRLLESSVCPFSKVDKSTPYAGRTDDGRCDAR